VVALITDMDQPLGRKVGNALEVEECVEVLRGGGPQDLVELSLKLSAWMFYLGGRAATVEEGERLAAELIANGKAMHKFLELTRLQGGDAKALEDTSRLPQAKNRTELRAACSGFVSGVDCEMVGVASLVLGGGREKKEDVIDPAVGLVLHKRVGDAVAAGEPLVTIHYNSDARLGESQGLLQRAYQIGSDPVKSERKLVQRVIEGKA
jgi:pyrimidine-nucleoside phosphorylase